MFLLSSRTDFEVLILFHELSDSKRNITLTPRNENLLRWLSLRLKKNGFVVINDYEITNCSLNRERMESKF